MFLAGGASAALHPLSLTFTDNTGVSDSSNDVTFSSRSIGAAPAAGESRFVVAMFHHEKETTGNTVTGVFIGGATPTTLASFNYDVGGSRTLILAYREIPTGTTADFRMTISANGGRKAVGVYRVIGQSGSSIALYGTETTDTGANPTLSLDVSSGGVVIAGTNVEQGSACTWTGLTENYDVDLNSGEYYSGASATISTTETKTITTSLTGTSPVGMSACIIPAA